MGSLDGVAVAGFFSYALPPDVSPPRTPANPGAAGKETNAIFKFEITDPVNLAGTFLSVPATGVFPVNKGQGTGNYTATTPIDSSAGTGALAGASGFFTISGPAFAPVLPPPAILGFAVGLWSAEVNGKICPAT